MSADSSCAVANLKSLLAFGKTVQSLPPLDAVPQRKGPLAAVSAAGGAVLVYEPQGFGALRASCRWGRYVTGVPAVATALATALVEASRAARDAETVAFARFDDAMPAASDALDRIKELAPRPLQE